MKLYALLIALLLLAAPALATDADLEPYTPTSGYSYSNNAIQDGTLLSFVTPQSCPVETRFRADYDRALKGDSLVTRFGAQCEVGERVILVACNAPSTSPFINCQRLFTHDYLKEFPDDLLDLRYECGLDENGEELDGEYNCFNRAWFRQAIGLDLDQGAYVGYDCTKCPAGTPTNEPGTNPDYQADVDEDLNDGTTSTSIQTTHDISLEGPITVSATSLAQSSDTLTVSQKAVVQTAGTYWLEAGLWRQKGLSIVDINENQCDPGDTWYANKQVTLSPGEHLIEWTLTTEALPADEREGVFYVHTAVVDGCGGETISERKLNTPIRIGTPGDDWILAGISGGLLAALLGAALIIGGTLYLVLRKR